MYLNLTVMTDELGTFIEYESDTIRFNWGIDLLILDM